MKVMNFLMKSYWKIVCILPLFWTVSTYGQENPTAKWEFYTAIEGKFRVKVPGDMTLKTDTIETDIGDMAYHTYFYQTTDPTKSNVLYMVSYCDYPPYSMHSDSTELMKDFFESTMDAATFSIAGDLIYSDDISLNGYPGKFWRIDYLQGDAVIKTKAFMVESRYYSIQVIMLKKLSLNPDVDRFLESFGLL